MGSVKNLIAGNYKMNGDLQEIYKVEEALGKKPAACDVLICPPATILGAAPPLKNLKLGGQDCHTAEQGAHTGDISAALLRDAGAGAVIVGHSERRQDHNENNQLIRAKAEAAHANKLLAIICVGETSRQRKDGKTLTIIRHQLRYSMPDGCTAKNTVIAYEPIWAIGTGLTPSEEQVEEVHSAMRKTLQKRFDDADKMRLLYGGSVKPDNAASLLAIENVNGALVGGASLKAKDFLKIIYAQ